MDTLLLFAIQNLPGIIKGFRDLLADDPNAPNPTDKEVLEALKVACESSILKDDFWLAAHPQSEE